MKKWLREDNSINIQGRIMVLENTDNAEQHSSKLKG